MSDEEIEAALLDAELFLKYRAPRRAVERLREAVAHRPRSIQLREKLREIAAAHGPVDEAARQCLALANLYIAREDFEAAHERLLQAKHVDQRINIAPGLEAIRRARRPVLQQIVAAAAPPPVDPEAPRRVTFAGDLSVVSVFDAIQVIENSRLTGVLSLEATGASATVFFNAGNVVDAESGKVRGNEAFRVVVEMTDGAFDFRKTEEEYPVRINTPGNTNLILDTLRQLDEERQGGEAVDD